MTVLFLYTELAEYFLKCCEKLSESSEVHIVRWPVNKEAPFEFKFSDKIKVYNKENYSLQGLRDLVKKISPSVIICSGWVDRDYLRITSSYYRKVPTIMTCDTHWTGSIKQYFAVVLSRIFLLRTFSHAWVPGSPQHLYATKLGFQASKIKRGFYCCDLPKFNEVYKKRKQTVKGPIRRFLYVGRYYDFKGIRELWTAFIEAKKDLDSEWELWCLGTGDVAPLSDPSIRHFGFVQPKDLDPILAECDVFVLPSRFEPWGVVVQEYAASGFPLVLSSAVGAAEMFLIEGENGYQFSKGDEQELKAALKKIMNLSPKELNSMSERSHELAQLHTPYKWANTVLEIYNESKKE